MLNYCKLTDAQSRSISSENRNGGKSGGGRDYPEKDESGNFTGPARELGIGWKTHPFDVIKPGETYEMANINGSGCINHIWLTLTGRYRSAILRVYYENQSKPSIEVPLADFFASAFTHLQEFAPIDSQVITVNPGNAFNSYWAIPFKKNIRMTLENRDFEDMTLYYQVDYDLKKIPDDIGYLHAQFRRTNPMKVGEVHTILDGVKGQGHYVGTYMAWQMNNNCWWGEGEVKFYLDGDADPEISGGKVVGGSTGFPTICTTGTEDYFCGSYNFEDQKEKRYREYTTLYSGVPHIVRPDGLYNANLRFSMYRWHLNDAIHFQKDFKATVQALGWKKNHRFNPLQDDISSVAFWYQKEPFTDFPELPDDDALSIN